MLTQWETHKASLAEYFLNRTRRRVADVQSDHHILKCGLLENEERLQKKRKSLLDYLVFQYWGIFEIAEHRVIQDVLDICLEHESNSACGNAQLLKAEQERIYDVVMLSVSGWC